MDTRLPEEWRQDNSANNSNSFHGIGTTGAVVLGVLSGLAFGSSVFAMFQLQQTERESRMLEYYVLEMDAKLIASGVKKPEEAVSKKLKE